MLFACRPFIVKKLEYKKCFSKYFTFISIKINQTKHNYHPYYAFYLTFNVETSQVCRHTSHRVAALRKSKKTYQTYAYVRM